jgi:hypothetical protein
LRTEENKDIWPIIPKIPNEGKKFVRRRSSETEKGSEEKDEYEYEALYKGLLSSHKSTTVS